MKNQTKLNSVAFTLIELMIVVVILWILMSTVLPKLTWAQARSRDTSRIAELNSIASALQTYNDDEGYFPSWDASNPNAAECLSDSWWIVSSAIKIHLQGKTVPQDPQKTSNKWLCEGNTWRFWYSALQKDKMDNNAYVLCADMETYQKANTDAWAFTDKATWAAEVKDTDWVTWVDYSDVQKEVAALTTSSQKLTVDEDATRTVFCILRP